MTDFLSVAGWALLEGSIILLYLFGGMFGALWILQRSPLRHLVSREEEPRPVRRRESPVEFYLRQEREKRNRWQEDR